MELNHKQFQKHWIAHLPLIYNVTAHNNVDNDNKRIS